MSEILTIEQAAEFTSLSVKTLYRIAGRDSDSPFRKRGGRWLVVRSDLVAWVRSGECAKPRRKDPMPMPAAKRSRRGTFLREVQQLEEAS